MSNPDILAAEAELDEARAAKRASRRRLAEARYFFAERDGNGDSVTMAERLDGAADRRLDEATYAIAVARAARGNSPVKRCRECGERVSVGRLCEECAEDRAALAGAR